MGKLDNTSGYVPNYMNTSNTTPFEFYDEVRRHGEAVWDPTMNAWLVVSDAAVRKVVMDDTLFAQPYSSMRAGEPYKIIRINNPRSFQFMVGEEHRAMHRWWLLDLLSPRRIESYDVTVIVPAVERLIEGLRGKETFDLVDEFANLLPVSIFTELLGLPTDRASILHVKKLNDDIGTFAALANSLALEVGMTAEKQAIVDTALASAEELNQILLPYIRSRKDGKGEDFISRLWAGGPRLYEDWNEVDVLDACRRLYFAGAESSVHAISNAFYVLLNDRQLLERVRGGSTDVVKEYVEEALRLYGPAHFRIRRATEDTTLGDAQIKQGDMVIAIMLAANHDPGKYGCPHAVDMDRKLKRNHLAFIAGPRSCPGANLARAEMVVALERVLLEFPNIKFAPDAVEPQMNGFLMRSFRPLQVVPG